MHVKDRAFNDQRYFICDQKLAGKCKCAVLPPEQATHMHSIRIKQGVVSKYYQI